jgi:hypothetical protein
MMVYINALTVTLFSILLLSCASMGSESIAEKPRAIIEMQETALKTVIPKTTRAPQSVRVYAGVRSVC